MTEKKLNFPLVMTVYLLGIFMGALDTGIVTPARTIIQDSLGVGDKTGIWMITIYTLAYAASIPVMGKLADRMGRRTIYLVSIFLFGTGSLLCGISHGMNSFTMLLITRALQAIGGGGIVPIATAEFGTTFPEEKRGMALGMVGGVYGIANIFGASAGSAVLDIFGTDRWEFIFYVNVPIAIFIVIAGFFCLPNTREKSRQPIDGLGICILVVMVLSLMYGLKNIDFFNFVETITDFNVYKYLVAFAVLLPFFIIVERRAADPVMNLKYFTNIKIVMTLLVTIITGIVLMGVIFVPQFCENGLKVPSGSGGYFVIVLGICAGVGAMSSGKMTDKWGPRPVLAFGFIAAIIGSLIVIFFSSQNPGKLNVFASLIFIGLGIGFTMGAPLNYMMLSEVDEKEANSALATLSLVRSLGTVVAPAIMVGFIANAGMGMMDDIMGVLPNEIKVPELPYAEELMEAMKEQGVEGMPDLAEMTTVKFEMNGDTSDMDAEIPEALTDKLQNSDVTTITAAVKDMAAYMFDQMSPKIQDKISSGINKGIDGVNTGISGMNDAVSQMQDARAGMQKGIDGMGTALTKQKKSRSQMQKGYNALDTQIKKMQQGLDGINQGIEGVKQGIAAMNKKIEKNNKDIEGWTAEIEALDGGDDPDKDSKIAELNGKIGAARGENMGMQQGLNKAQQELGEMQGQAAGMKSAISQMTTQRDKLKKGISGISKGIDQVSGKRSELKSARAKMGEAISGIKSGIAEATTTRGKMIALRDAMPGAFEEAKADYLTAIDAKSEEIENTYQACLNVGFRQIFTLTAIGSSVGLVLLLLSGIRRKKNDEEAAAAA